MSYNLRYFLNFKDNASGQPVLVNISFPDFDGDPLELIPADSPLVVSELNSDENIFSPIRAKEYRIKFVTDNLVYPGIVDFATNNDSDWKIDILVNGTTWLTGFILTDQISEGWYTDNTNHYIELIATDNLGTLKKLPLKDIDGTDFVPTTKQYLVDIVKAALNQANSQLPINIYDNLFEVDMNDRNDTVVNSYTTTLTATAPHEFIYLIQGTLIHVGDTLVITGSVSNNGSFTVVSMDRSQYFAYITVAETVVNEGGTASVTMEVTHVTSEIDAYQQCMVDMRTFTSSYNTFEDAYSVLTKILESRNSILFQHMGEWVIIRISELFRFDTINGSHYAVDGLITAINNASWSADLNKDGDIIPVEQFMIKSFLNPVLSNTVTYKYQNFDELLCNEIWKRGTIVTNTDTLKEYEVDCWNHYQGAIISTTPASGAFGRREVIIAATEVISESYIFLAYETAGSHESFVISEPAQVSKDDKLNISFSRRLKNGYTGSGTEILARVLLFGNDGTYYTLDDDGLWYLSNVSFTVNAKLLVCLFSSGDDRAQWREKVIDCDYIPKDGQIKVMLYEGSQSNFTGQETHFKDLKLTYKSYLEGKTFVNVEGDYNKLTLSTNLKDTAEYDVYLSDSPKYLFKGALFMADGLTLTKLWYEMSDPDIQYPIKRFNAIDHYRMSRRNMLKVDGSFYKWIKGEPINSIQKITINNGDANKRFIPASIRDLDTSRSIFNSLLIEVYDETKASEPFSFSLIGEFRNPDAFDYLIGFDGTEYFNVGDVMTISDTASNNIVVTVVSKAISGSVYTITFSGATITNEFLSAPATFTTQKLNRVNATHKFDYIFKAK